MSGDKLNVESLDEAVLAGNSNPAYVGNLIADFIRSLMGQSISMSPTLSPVAAKFADILRHMSRFTPHDLMAAMRVAEESLRVDHSDSRYVSAAQSGTRYLLAKSAGDAYSSARASKAGSAFYADMRAALDLPARG